MICETSWCDCVFTAESDNDQFVLNELFESIIKSENSNYIDIKLDKKPRILTIQTYY